jgi:hypothetical protein
MLQSIGPSRCWAGSSVVISREEANRALAESDATRARAQTLQGYRHFSGQVMIWGAIWVLANGLSDLLPAYGSLIWAILVIAGVVASMMAGARNGRLDGSVRASDARHSWRWAGSIMVVALFFAGAFAILPPVTGAQSGAFISLFFAAAYMVLGIWAGWKILAVGVCMTVLILLGYFSGAPHLQLWCGAIAGGAMLLGGWWMRRA